MEAEDSVETTCPKCRTRLRVNRRSIEKPITCRVCATTFSIAEVGKNADNGTLRTSSVISPSSIIKIPSKEPPAAPPTISPKSIDLGPDPPPFIQESFLPKLRDIFVMNEWQSVSRITGKAIPNQAEEYIRILKRRQQEMSRGLFQAGFGNGIFAIITLVITFPMASVLFLILFPKFPVVVTAVDLLIVAIVIGVIVVEIMGYDVRQKISRLELDANCKLGELIEEQWRLLAARIAEAMQPKSPLRFRYFSNVLGIVYTSEFACFAHVIDDRYIVVEVSSIRDITLSHRQVGASSYGSTSSNQGSAVVGALVGGLIWGGPGMVTGAIVGSSSSQRTRANSVQHYSWLVDLYTRLEAVPIVTVDFDQDEVGAKDFYATLNVGLERLK